jgi:isoleucyl-tRNA synthetase
VYKFYAQYKDTVAHIAHADSQNILDQWILARLTEVHAQVTAGYETYNLNAATRPLIDFVDDLSTWYLRRSRDRIKDAADNPAAAAEALATMRYVFAEFTKLAAPSMPFIADWLWSNVKGARDAESVHLAQWTTGPTISVGQQSIDSIQLITYMRQIRGVITNGLEERAKNNLKVRQPLAHAYIQENDGVFSSANPLRWMTELIMDELNVKEVSVSRDLSKPLVLDIRITPELKREGEYRDLLRSVQELRKNTGLNPGDSAMLTLPNVHKDTVEPFMADLKKVANLVEVTYGEGSDMMLEKA